MQSIFDTLIDKHYAHSVCVRASAYNFTTSEKYVCVCVCVCVYVYIYIYIYS